MSSAALDEAAIGAVAAKGRFVPQRASPLTV